MKIGNISFEGKAILAPMAGVSDKSFRELCTSFGAAYVISEMVSSKGLQYSDRKSKELMELSPAERPAAIQIFGDQPEIMAKAAEKAMEFEPQAIDINMGCPAPKISNSGGGCALMKRPDLCGDIVSAVKKAVSVPVTVKIRKGWDKNSINAVEVACICEQAGADAIAVHGRTREDMYTPPADWDIIRQVKEAVSIPVIGNGDVDSPLKAEALLKQTGCDGVMIGRAVRGNPWIFREMNHYFQTGELLPRPSSEEIREMILRHARAQIALKGEFTGIREMRKHVAWYTAGMRHSAGLRRASNTIESYEALQELLMKL